RSSDLDMPVDVRGGRGQVQAALALAQGRLQGLQAKVNVRDLHVRLGARLPEMSLSTLSGRIVARDADGVSQLKLQDVAFRTADGLVWPRSSAQLEWRHGTLAGAGAVTWLPTPGKRGATSGETNGRTGGEFSADRLDLALLARLADRLPLADGLRRQLAELAPQGVATQLTGNWSGPVDSPTSYRIKGQFKGLAWAASGATRR